ncbi:unnamed protein product [Sphagnum balticum]
MDVTLAASEAIVPSLAEFIVTLACATSSSNVTPVLVFQVDDVQRRLGKSVVPVKLCCNGNVALHQFTRQMHYNGSFRRWVKRQSIISRPIRFPWQQTRPVLNGNSRKAS